MREFWSDFRYGFANPGLVIRAEFFYQVGRLRRVRLAAPTLNLRRRMAG